MPDPRLSGRTALVTGASSGLGAATAQALALEGAELYILGRNEEGLSETARAIQQSGGRAHMLVADFSQPGAASAAVEQVASDAGHIDILVNNAAVLYFGDVADQTVQMWQDMFQVNVIALLEASKAAIHAMRAQKTPGHIVNISSFAVRLDPGGVYGASKAAVDQISQQMRHELEEDDIRVVNIVPGAFATNLGRSMTDDQRAQMLKAFERKPVAPDAEGRTPIVGLPSDIANAVVYAVTQPINLNVFEMVVRPAMNTTI